jgi:SAM-dependent methyltransferase
MADNGDHAIDALSYHAISEVTHRVLNPLSAPKLDSLVAILATQPPHRMLDLACGKGEMACRFALAAPALEAMGVDVYEPFVDIARRRAAELDVVDRARFRVAEAAAYCRSSADTFDLVCCIGATWIGGGLAGTVELMRPRVTAGGWLLVGECFTTPAGTPPSADAPEGDLADVLTTLDRAELQLVEMVIASPDDWDRYAASQWLNVEQWLQANPDDPRVAAVRAERDASQRAYLAHDRDHLGWGVFVTLT